MTRLALSRSRLDSTTRCQTLASSSFVALMAVAALGCGVAEDESKEIGPENSSNVTLAFEQSDLVDLCEDVIRDFAEGEPSPWRTEQQALEAFIDESSILEGLDLSDGIIELRGEQVGTYDLVERPAETYEVASAQWCYPGPE